MLYNLKTKKFTTQVNIVDFKWERIDESTSNHFYLYTVTYLSSLEKFTYYLNF